MKLNKKRSLASRTLNVGFERVLFNTKRLAEINDALTKQDIRDLLKGGAIKIADIKGRRKIIKRKRKGPGKRKNKPRKGKREYVLSIRKFRRYLLNLKRKNKISLERYTELRKEIRRRTFKSFAQLKNSIVEVKL